MKKLALFALIAAVASLALFVTFRWATLGRFLETTDNAFLKADTIVIAPKVPGRIARVAIADNALVHEGDVLAVIEDADYSARLRQAEAEVMVRRAALETVSLKIAQAGAEIAGAAATVKSTQASLSLQRLERQRAAELAKESFATRRTLDQANAALSDWSGRLEGAAAGLDAAKASASIAEAQVLEADAALAAAEAARDLARQNLLDTVIRAPKDGVVGNLAARVGQYVSPGQRLATVVPLAEVYVVANFKETQIRRISPGARVEIEVDAYPGVAIEGEVESLSPASGAEFSLLPPENATGNFTKIVQRMPVRIKVTHAPATVALLPGLSVEAVVDTRGGEKDAPTALFAPRADDAPAGDARS